MVSARIGPVLLASISGALASFGMNILKAEAFGNRRGQALDTFIFADPHRTLELNPDEAGHLQDVVLQAVTGKVDVAKLIEKRRKPLGKPRVDPKVSGTNSVSETSTLIQIVAEDRPGLLYDLAQHHRLNRGEHRSGADRYGSASRGGCFLRQRGWREAGGVASESVERPSPGGLQGVIAPGYCRVPERAGRNNTGIIIMPNMFGLTRAGGALVDRMRRE